METGNLVLVIGMAQKEVLIYISGWESDYSIWKWWWVILAKEWVISLIGLVRMILFLERKNWCDWPTAALSNIDWCVWEKGCGCGSVCHSFDSVWWLWLMLVGALLPRWVNSMVRWWFHWSCAVLCCAVLCCAVLINHFCCLSHCPWAHDLVKYVWVISDCQC